MKKGILLILLSLFAFDASSSGACPALLDYTVKPLSGGAPISLCSTYEGQVLLVVNTASMCGYTTQLKGLEALYQRYRVLGQSAQPFFKALTEASGVAPSWNFQKYLIDRSGRVLKSYPANVTPEDILLKIDLEAALKTQR